jgi:hypothetical protein
VTGTSAFLKLILWPIRLSFHDLHLVTPIRIKELLAECEQQPIAPSRPPEAVPSASHTPTPLHPFPFNQLNNTKMTLSPLKNILLMNLSLLTPLLPGLLPRSVHISLTFSSTMLQWRSKALTRASSLRLLRHEIRTWVWERVAVWRMDRGPVESSWDSRREISYSLFGVGC